MRRRRRAVLLATGFALIVAAGACWSWAEASGAASNARPALSAEDRKSLARSLANVFDALPRPSKGYRLDKDANAPEIATATTAWAIATKAPADAAATHVYERPKPGNADENDVVEIRVYLNRERTLPDALGSEGGTLETFTQDGMPCSRLSLAGVTPGRVALPLRGDQDADALTVLRAHVGVVDVEPYLIEISQGRTPRRSPWDGEPARRLSQIRTIVVEYYGPRAEVERLMKATPAAPLRALLTP